MTQEERRAVREEAFAEGAAACETRVAAIDEIFWRRRPGNPWVNLLHRESRECAALIRGLTP